MFGSNGKPPTPIPLVNGVDPSLKSTAVQPQGCEEAEETNMTGSWAEEEQLFSDPPLGATVGTSLTPFQSKDRWRKTQNSNSPSTDNFVPLLTKHELHGWMCCIQGMESHGPHTFDAGPVCTLGILGISRSGHFPLCLSPTPPQCPASHSVH